MHDALMEPVGWGVMFAGERVLARPAVAGGDEPFTDAEAFPTSNRLTFGRAVDRAAGRALRVAAVKAAIVRGEYDTDEKLDVAIEAILRELETPAIAV